MNKLNGYTGENLLMEIATGGTFLDERTRHWVGETASALVSGRLLIYTERMDYYMQMRSVLVTELRREPWLRALKISEFLKVVDAAMREICARADLLFEEQDLPYPVEGRR